MNKTTSLYLDLVRFMAAFIVLIYHFAYARFSGGGLQFFRDTHIGSDAVIVFFVLSGYVIAYVSAQQDRTVQVYFLNRLARLWSVVIPALCLTIVVDQLGILINPQAYQGWWYQGDHPIFRSLVNVLFVNEIWFKSIRPFSNGPFWSLSYEFWYYVIFAASFYFKGLLRLLLILISLLIMGPKILLLLPIWLMGVWAWRINQRLTLSRSMAGFLFTAPVLIYIVIKVIGFDQLCLDWTASLLRTDDVDDVLGFSDEFLISYVYGLLIMANFIGVNALGKELPSVLLRYEKTIRGCAGLTFSIYLFHYPLLQFFSSVYSPSMALIWRNLLILFSTIIVIVILGRFTENKKSLMRKLIASAMSRFESLIRAKG